MHLEILLIELFVSLIFNETCDIMIKNEPLDKQSSNPKNNDVCLDDWNAEKENCSNVCKHSNFDPLIETLRQEWVLPIKDWTCWRYAIESKSSMIVQASKLHPTLMVNLKSCKVVARRGKPDGSKVLGLIALF